MRRLKSLILLSIVFLFSPVLFAEEFPQSATAGVEAENLKKQIPHEQKVRKLGQGIYESIKCIRVIDAATIEIATGEQVRLIGLEIADKISKEAKDFVKNLVEGKDVILEFDVQKKDKTGRLLAYVYILVVLDMKPSMMSDEDKETLTPLDDSGNYELFLNAEIVKQGHVNIITTWPNVKYDDVFKKLYQEARDNKRGIWKNE